MLLFFPLLIQGQTPEKSYLNCEIKDFKSGYIELVSNNRKDFYFHLFQENQSAKIIGGKFKLVNPNPGKEPEAFRFIVKSESFIGETDIVLLSKDVKNIIIDSVDEHISPTVINIKGEKETQSGYHNFFSEIVADIRKLGDEENAMELKYGNAIPAEQSNILKLRRDILSRQSDSAFLIYAAQYKNSFFALWKLIERFERKGFNADYERILNFLSPDIKNSLAARTLKSELNKVNFPKLKSQFPNLKLRTLLNKEKVFIKYEYGKKYTLIDFWFAKCIPCLKEFPLYLNIYKQYQSSGFKMIGISVDQTQNIENWIKIIHERNLIWPNFLDENEIMAKSFGIKFYPSNFLLDENGNIIHKNISPSELKDFLFQNLEFKNADDNHPKIEPD